MMSTGSWEFKDGSTMSANFNPDGDLVGESWIQDVNPDGSRFTARRTYSNGKLTGPSEEYEDGVLTWVGNLNDGARVGYRALRGTGGGWWLGNDGKEDERAPTGNNVMFFYPVHHSDSERWAIVGEYRSATEEEQNNGLCENQEPVLVKGKCVQVNEKCHPTSFVVLERYPYFRAPHFNAFSYAFDPSTHDVISKNPMIIDDWESRRVKVSLSTTSNAAQGLFARRDLQAGSVVCMYNGVRLTHEEVDGRHWDKNDNTISLNDDVVLDVPIDSIPIDIYCASVGHKANHDFSPNAKYAPFYHPRFGPIKSVVAIKDIKQGDEVFCDYGITHEEVSEGGETKLVLPKWLEKIWHLRPEGYEKKEEENKESVSEQENFLDG